LRAGARNIMGGVGGKGTQTVSKTVVSRAAHPEENPAKEKKGTSLPRPRQVHKTSGELFPMVRSSAAAALPNGEHLKNKKECVK